MKLKDVLRVSLLLIMLMGLCFPITSKSSMRKPISLSKQEALAQKISSTHKISVSDAHLYVQEAYLTGKDHNLDPNLILAIISVESSFRANAKSKMGATGLMQVMPHIHKDKFKHYGGIRSAKNPIVSIRVGSSVLKQCLTQKKGDVVKALQAYNGAPLRTEYAQKVLKAKQYFDIVTSA